ncbi:c-type cytochrome [Winogradskyella sp. UBA3174]|uniref:c-type cytochrome n=1 Tax=Winogradskyella sp. UBA3174 TaxID=1947785 RepID=UPI0025FBBF15|nr:cytochrome c [Winogradskyella sp. UBA3174]|tara:strand:+ start:25681 stop:26163 length:483 start_codon:yes stop_codon:yes gene_type:complete
MVKSLKFLALVISLIVFSCGERDKKEESSYGKKEPLKTEKKEPASKRIELSNKGVGPITSVDLGLVVDQDMATHGKEIYGKMCTACHKADKKFIGPSPTGILKRRSPEWVMNMILNPEGMTKEDPLAKDLLMEFNGAPMANQGLTKEDARAVLEYFRTLK